MNTVIHPEDRTTTFLKPIYEQVNDKVVVEKDTTPQEIETLLLGSDRVLMMGHGSPRGLFSVGLFNKARHDELIRESSNWIGRYGYAISDATVELLKDKPENIYIWCNANRFVEEHELKGFYSGMFISEVGEAHFCGLKGVTQQTVDESNDTFSAIVGKYINSPVAELYEKVMEEYGVLAETNPVAKYNHDRLYLR